jgi:RHS repeat-associated protein
MYATLTYPNLPDGRFFTKERVRGYRFGFNGKEKVDEVYGDANAYDFGARLYDPRLGRWLAVDPLAVKYSFVSPYQFVNNSPLIFIDPNGKEWINVYDADVERINNDLLKNPNDKKLQRDLVRAIDNQATVNKIINDIKTNDVALFNYIDNLQVSDAYTGELKNIK